MWGMKLYIEIRKTKHVWKDLHKWPMKGDRRAQVTLWGSMVDLLNFLLVSTCSFFWKYITPKISLLYFLLNFSPIHFSMTGQENTDWELWILPSQWYSFKPLISLQNKYLLWLILCTISFCFFLNTNVCGAILNFFTIFYKYHEMCKQLVSMEGLNLFQFPKHIIKRGWDSEVGEKGSVECCWSL